MKRAVILHGTDAVPEGGWRPWLREMLELEGYEVWVPALPGNNAPDRNIYNDFLFNSGWDFTDNIIVGHSSGAVAVLNLLMDDRCPKVKLAVPVSGWAGGLPQGFKDKGQFDALFPPEGFNFELIKSKAGKIAFVHGEKDPYCLLGQAEYLARQLDASLTVIANGDHLGSPRRELPEVWRIIQKSL